MGYQVLPEGLLHFLDFIFLDEAVRLSAGKNSDEPMRGLFISYSRPSSQRRGKASVRRGRACVHGSDLSLRRYVAIKALLRWGCSLKVACIEVGDRLGKQTEKELNVIKSGYEKFRPPYPDDELLRMWEGAFLWWKQWVRTAPQSTIDFVVMQYIPSKSRSRRTAERFLALANRIRGSTGSP